MEELLELKQLLQQGQTKEALLLVEDLEEMNKKGLTRNIRSYAKVLLLHLIKRSVENRTTKSWDASIRNAVREINDLNARPKGRGVYLDDEELLDAIASSFKGAVDRASLEVAEGIYDFGQIERMINRGKMVSEAFRIVKENQHW